MDMEEATGVVVASIASDGGGVAVIGVFSPGVQATISRVACTLMGAQREAIAAAMPPLI